MSGGLRIGTRVDRYEIEEQIGVGAFGVVYRARHLHLPLQRAIKVLHFVLAQQPDERNRFLSEARFAAGLKHRHILPVHDVFEDHGNLFLLMELVSSRSLAERIETGALPAHTVVDLVDQIAAALDYAHSKGVVHRDVKPSNILFNDKEEVLLTDFGIAWVQEQARRTGVRTAMGTPAYMSPLQCRGNGDIDRRSDVYSLAVVTFELLTGRPPYGHGWEAISGHLGSGSLPSVRSANPSLPVGVDAVVHRGMARDIERRYSTAGELARSLRAIVQVDPVRINDVDATQPLTAPAEIPTQPPGSPAAGSPVQLSKSSLAHDAHRPLAQSPLRTMRSRKRPLSALAIGLVVVVAGIAAVVTRAPASVVAHLPIPGSGTGVNPAGPLLRGPTDEMVKAAVLPAFANCAQQKVDKPEGCPQQGLDEKGVGGEWTLHGDPSWGAQVIRGGTDRFTIKGRFAMTLRLNIDRTPAGSPYARSDDPELDAAPYVAHAHWDGKRVAIDNLLRAPDGPLLAPFPKATNKAILTALASHFEHCLQMDMATPYIDYCPANRNFFGTFKANRWTMVGDPTHSAQVSFDSHLGIYKISGSLDMDSYVPWVNSINEMPHRGDYTVFMAWDGDHAVPVYAKLP